jgi:FkbM family methyltransferase
MRKLIQYLKLPLNAIRLFFEATENAYSTSEKLAIYKILLRLRFKEIGEKKNTIIIQDIFGFKVHAYDYTTLLFLFREIFLSRDYLFETKLDQPKIIDCGANIGMSIFFHKYFHPNAKIIAFEPNPSAFELLKLNIEKNNLKDITLVQKAVSNSLEPISFFVNNDKGSLLSSVREDRGGTSKIEIETDLLSNYLNEKVDLLKIDIEGAEWQVLEDLKANGKHLANVEHAIIEYHHKINGEASRLTSFLSYFESCKYEYNIRTYHKLKGDFQDLIIHFYRD